MAEQNRRRWWSRKSQSFGTLAELGAHVATNPPTPIWIQDPGIPLYGGATSAIDGIWGSQPSVRKVVDFIGSNIASIPIHVYDRVGDDDRQRVTDHPLARLLDQPSPPVADEPGGVTAFRFWHSIIVDWLMHDRWCAIKVKDGADIRLQRIPPRRFRLPVDNLDRVISVRFWDDNGRVRDFDPADFVWDAGYCDPSYSNRPFAESGMAGTSPMQTILQVLAEAAEAVAYRRSVWKNGARVPAVIERPAGVGWSDIARARFQADMSNYLRGGGKEGGVPVLEDGMKLAEVNAFNPQETQDLEGRRLSDIEVAAFYHIAPELVGARQGNYANMDAFRQGLYRESLGPYIFQLAQVINLHLTRDLAGGRALYAEHFLEAKLAGSFQEQSQVLQTATGAPWMLRSEARARMNLPFVPGTDKPVVPLNVLVGGQASPTDSASQNVGAGKGQRGRGAKAAATDPERKKAAQVLADFFKRQGSVVMSRLGAGAEDWWDADRWDSELGADLFAVASYIATRAGQATMESLALEPETYDVDRTAAYLAALAKADAKKINAVTEQQVSDALDEDEPLDAVGDVFDEAENSRSDLAGAAFAVSLAAWGTMEAGRQLGREGTTKTWITGENPRPEHAAMDGETVPIGEAFSNGSMWPGDGQDGEYGCNCSVEITVG